jgi:hypothetical protein
VSRVELLDEVMMKAINLANDKTFPEEITLMFEFIGTGANFLHFACFFPFCSFVHLNTLCIRMLAVQSNQGIVFNLSQNFQTLGNIPLKITVSNQEEGIPYRSKVVLSFSV